MRELDACGIGFVADAAGTSARTIITAALEGLARVKHRGALAADARTSDGTGLLTPIPAGLFGDDTGVAVLLTRAELRRSVVEQAAEAEGLVVTGWRVPPTDDAALGELARRSRPEIIEALLGAPGLDGDQREIAAFAFRRRLGRELPELYVASCSFRTIVHKGLVAADRLAEFYLDLADERYAAPFAIFHQRFSTNTLPTWERAQPFRMLCHNGEINTISGNADRMLGRGAARLDRGRAGRRVGAATGARPRRLRLRHARRRGRAAGARRPACAPRPGHAHARGLGGGPRPRTRRCGASTAYHSTLMEPWDGPAGVVFTDGIGVGAVLDRNGLRPLRYAVCDDGLRGLRVGDRAPSTCRATARSSGAGWAPATCSGSAPTAVVVHNLDAQAAAGHRRARTRSGRPRACRVCVGPSRRGGARRPAPPRRSSTGTPRRSWPWCSSPWPRTPTSPPSPWATTRPSPPMAGRPRPIADYLRQRFAQVTNPPIDPLRERRVMSLRMLPRAAGPAAERAARRGPAAADRLVLPLPVGHRCAARPRREPVLHRHADRDGGGHRAATTTCGPRSSIWPTGPNGPSTTAQACSSCSTRSPTPARHPCPACSALGAVHRRLTVTGAPRPDQPGGRGRRRPRRRTAWPRCWASGPTRSARGSALQTVAAEADAEESEAVSADAQDRFRAAVETGVLKILSKMGICTVDAYRGARTFEVIGLHREVVDPCFGPAASVVGGIGWAELAADVRPGSPRPTRPLRPTGDAPTTRGPDLESPGYFRVRKGGEYHANGKEVVAGPQRPHAGPGDATGRRGPLADAQVREMAAAAPAAAGHRAASPTRPTSTSPALVEESTPHRAARPARARRRGRRRSRSTRWSRPRPSPTASRRGPCRTARSRRRPTRPSPGP